MAGQPPDLAAMMRGMSAPQAGGAPNPMAAMMQGMMGGAGRGGGGGGGGGGPPDMAAIMQQMGPMMSQMGPMMAQMGRGAAPRPGGGGGAPPANPMAAMMQSMMGGAGPPGGGGGGEPDMMSMLGPMMQSMGPMIKQMNMGRSQSAPHMQRKKGPPPLQLGPIEGCLAVIHAELVALALGGHPADPNAEAEAEQARRLALQRLIGGVQAAFAELRQMMVGLANLLKEPAYRSDAAFRTKVGKLGEVVAAALSDVGAAITTTTEVLAQQQSTAAPAVAVPSGDDSDDFHSADEDEDAPAPPPPVSRKAPTLKKPGTGRAPTKAAMAAVQAAGDGWLKELPESERELWRSVVNADGRRQVGGKNTQTRNGTPPQLASQGYLCSLLSALCSDRLFWLIFDVHSTPAAAEPAAREPGLW